MWVTVEIQIKEDFEVQFSVSEIAEMVEDIVMSSTPASFLDVSYSITDIKRYDDDIKYEKIIDSQHEKIRTLNAENERLRQLIGIS